MKSKIMLALSLVSLLSLAACSNTKQEEMKDSSEMSSSMMKGKEKTEMSSSMSEDKMESSDMKESEMSEDMDEKMMEEEEMKDQ